VVEANRFIWPEAALILKPAVEEKVPPLWPVIVGLGLAAFWQ
jgi:hypothetical protein